MKFLENLYEMENFGLYLFAIIGILIVLFMIVLLLGKRDEKRRKEEEKKEIENNTNVTQDTNVTQETNNTLDTNTKVDDEQNNTSFAFHDEVVPSPVEAPVSAPVQNVTLEEESIPEVKEPVFTTTNSVLNDDVPSIEHEEQPKLEETPVVNVVTEETTPKIEAPVKEFDFDALANAISRELESIEKKEIPKVEEPKTINSNFKTYEPVDLEAKEELKEEVKNEPVKPRPVMPTVFSSVYVNREKEAKEPEKKEEQPVKPSFDLPKMVDLPKKVDENDK